MTTTPPPLLFLLALHLYTDKEPQDKLLAHCKAIYIPSETYSKPEKCYYKLQDLAKLTSSVFSTRSATGDVFCFIAGGLPRPVVDGGAEIGATLGCTVGGLACTVGEWI